MDRWKDPYVKDTEARVLADVIPGADVFLGLSAAGVLKPELLRDMAPKPLILALANPTPEIMPEVARAARPDAMICTGRSDFPNQVNNVLCFPYIFRGALDCGASAINEDMKMAAVRAIAALAREEPSDVAARAYSGETPIFGPDFLIPSPFDPRLILRIAPAVAKAACETGVATRPISDFPAYVDRSEPLRLPLRPRNEAGVFGGEELDGKSCHLRRWRGRTRAARRASGARRGNRPADPDRDGRMSWTCA